MKKLINIVEGHAILAIKKYTGIENEDVEVLAKQREKICTAPCKKDGNEVLQDGRCTLCNCVMEAKWRSLSAKCPLKKW